MNILILTHYFPPHRGGIENVSFNQARLLAGLGHNVTIVSSRIPSTESEYGDAFSVIRLPAWNILERKLGIPYPIFYPSAVRALRTEVKRSDVVNGHGHVYMPVVLGALLATLYHKPFVLTQHNTFIQYGSSVLRGVQHLADMTLGRATLACADEVVAVSGATKEYLGKIARIESTVIYNGVDVEVFHACKEREKIQRNLSIPLGKTVYLCIRRITSKNGIGTLLEVAEMLKHRRDLIFLIGGDGPDLPSSRKIVQQKNLENVLLLGSIGDDDLARYYAASDVFVLPSKGGEGLPLVVLEALASGLPVIATRSGGHVEIIRDGETGYIVEPDDVVGIANHVVALSENRIGLSRMQERSREFAVQMLSWEHNVEQLLMVMEMAIKEV